MRFYSENGRFASLSPPPWGLEATYDDHLRLIEKRVVDFGWCATSNIDSKSTISFQRGPVDPKFQVEWVASANHSSSQKTRLNDLSYGVKILTYLSSVLSQCSARVWQTDRRTDKQTPFSSLVALAFHAARKNYASRVAAITYARSATWFS